MKEGNGEPSLCLFGEKVTPNHHKLARQFVLLDNFYVRRRGVRRRASVVDGRLCDRFCGESLAARLIAAVRCGSCPRIRPRAATIRIARPAGGYIWDRCAEAKVSYRSYGEWVNDGKTPADPAKARVKALEGHIDPKFRGFDLDYPDQKRADRFIEELQRFEKEGDMPRLQHRAAAATITPRGTQVGKLTPTAMVADNDLALGRVVEAVSKSKFWKETAIFVLEDDAQNGPDHVDAHRSVALVISPYTKRGNTSIRRCIRRAACCGRWS